MVYYLKNNGGRKRERERRILLKLNEKRKEERECNEEIFRIVEIGKIE